MAEGLDSILTSGLDQDFYNALDQVFKVQEEQQLQSTLEGLNERGFLQSGQTFKEVSENVLGPAVARRQAAILPLAREERGREREFSMTRQLREEDFTRNLEQLQRQLDANRELIRVQQSYTRQPSGGFFNQLIPGIAQGLGTGLGAGLFGGLSGGLAGFGSSIYGSNRTPRVGER